MKKKIILKSSILAVAAGLSVFAINSVFADELPVQFMGVNDFHGALEQNIYQVEVLNQLDQVPAVGALISIAFPHWDKATGSPVRAIAILP